MTIVKLFTALFLLPGTLVLNMLNISVESDGGVFRSLINMIFWGVVAVMLSVPFLF